MNVPFLKLKCQKCSHEWGARTSTPMCCPRCKSYLWDAKMNNFENKEETQREGMSSVGISAEKFIKEEVSE